MLMLMINMNRIETLVNKVKSNCFTCANCPALRRVPLRRWQRCERFKTGVFAVL